MYESSLLICSQATLNKASRPSLQNLNDIPGNSFQLLHCRPLGGRGRGSSWLISPVVAHSCPLGFFTTGHYKTNSVTEHRSAWAAVWGSAGLSHLQHRADEGPSKGEQRSSPTGSAGAMSLLGAAVGSAGAMLLLGAAAPGRSGNRAVGHCVQQSGQTQAHRPSLGFKQC